MGTWWRALLWWRPPCLYQTVIVNLISDRETALQGVLWRSRGAWLILRNVYALPRAGAVKRVDGEVVIHRANVAFFQVVPDDRP